MRLHALHRAPPPAADSVGCVAGRRTCSEREPGTEKLCDQVHQGGLLIVGAKPSEAPAEGHKAAGLHIVGAKPSEASAEGQRSQ